MSGPRSFQSDQFGQRRAVRLDASGVAVSRPARLSAIFGALFFVPLAPVVAVIAAFIGFKQISTVHGMRGGKLAWIGLSLGLLFTVVQTAAGLQGWRMYTFVADAPGQALQLAYAGNTAAFRGQFSGAGREASDDEVQAFVTALQEEFGRFVDLEPANLNSMFADLPGEHVRGEYRASFAKGLTDVQVDMAVNPPDGLGFFQTRIERITIRTPLDPDRHTITFPPPHVAVAVTSD